MQDANFLASMKPLVLGFLTFLMVTNLRASKSFPLGDSETKNSAVQGQDHTKGIQIKAYQSVSTQGTAHTQNQFSSRHVDCVSAWDDVQTFCKTPGGPQRKVCSDHLTDTVTLSVTPSVTLSVTVHVMAMPRTLTSFA